MREPTQIVRMQVQPDIQTANAAIDIAVLDTIQEQIKLKMAAIREKINDEREEISEWIEYDSQKAEFDADTKERRRELAELRKAAADAIAETKLGKELEKERETMFRVKLLLGRRRAESNQLLMPFVATANLDGE